MMRGDVFYRPGVARAVARMGLLLLAVVVLAEWPLPLHSHFTLADFFAFHALYGFVSCLLLIVAARGLGRLIKRPDDYYDDRGDD